MKTLDAALKDLQDRKAPLPIDVKAERRRMDAAGKAVVAAQSKVDEYERLGESHLSYNEYDGLAGHMVIRPSERLHEARVELEVVKEQARETSRAFNAALEAAAVERRQAAKDAWLQCARSTVAPNIARIRRAVMAKDWRSREVSKLCDQIVGALGQDRETRQVFSDESKPNGLYSTREGSIAAQKLRWLLELEMLWERELMRDALKRDSQCATLNWHASIETVAEDLEKLGRLLGMS